MICLFVSMQFIQEFMTSIGWFICIRELSLVRMASSMGVRLCAMVDENRFPARRPNGRRNIKVLV